MRASIRTSRGRGRHLALRLLAVASAVVLTSTLVVGASAAPVTTKPYTATWLDGGVAVANPPNTLSVAPGSQTLVLRLTNGADPQSLGSADITPPAGYTLTGGSLTPSIGSASVAGNTLRLRDLNLASGASVAVSIAVSAPCVGGASQTWTLTVKQANSFNGPPGNDFIPAPNTVAPSTEVSGSACRLRFANQPTTTRTAATITDGFASSGDPIAVEIYDPATGAVVDSDATVTLAPEQNPAGGTLSGGSADAVAGTATFPALSLDRPGPYTLKASSPAAVNEPVSDLFMVSDTVETCSGPGCSFNVPQGPNSYTTTPDRGANGATFAASLNLPGLRISCDFAPFSYPDSRQPNAVWYVYDDGNTASGKTNVIVIDKAIVQATPENGASFYRVCYTSPIPFTSRTGDPAPPDPWTTPDGGQVGPSVYFGTTWYTGLLPDCDKKRPVAPCVVSWTGDSGGNRLGTFLTPPGDPGYR